MTNEFGAPAVVLERPKTSRLPLIVPIRPMAKARPRVTRKGTFMPKRYVAWCGQFRKLCASANRGPLLLPPAIFVRFVFAAPKKERTRRGAHQQTPDLDNLLGAVMDALTPDKSESDAHVYAIAGIKQWGQTDCITIYEWPAEIDIPKPTNHPDNEHQKHLF